MFEGTKRQAGGGSQIYLPLDVVGFRKIDLMKWRGLGGEGGCFHRMAVARLSARLYARQGRHLVEFFVPLYFSFDI